MSYPPQSGQPYGQNPQGQSPGEYPPSGGFPQQGGQYGYPPQGQYSGPGPGGQYPPGGQPSKKTGLWIGLSAVVVAVVAFVITAFVAPGFLLGDDDDKDDDKGTASGNTGDSENSDAKAVAQYLVDAANSNDAATLTQLACADADSDIADLIDDIGALDQLQATGPVQEMGDQAQFPVIAVVQGTPNEAVVGLFNEGNGWCWSSVTVGAGGSGSPDMPGGPGGPGDMDSSSTGDDPAVITENFVDAVNAGDKSGALELVCEDDSTDRLMEKLDEAIEGSANFTVSSGDQVPDLTYYYEVEVSGTVAGEEVTGEISLNAIVEDAFCVDRLFFLAE